LGSADKLRSCVVKDELDSLLNHRGERRLAWWAVMGRRAPDDGSVARADIKDRRIPILILSNKIDMPESLSPVEWTQMLDLTRIKNKSWRIMCVLSCALTAGAAPSLWSRSQRSGTNAIAGTGLQDGVEWLSEQIKAA
jgi:hypothetical protein